MAYCLDDVCMAWGLRVRHELNESEQDTSPAMRAQARMMAFRRLMEGSLGPSQSPENGSSSADPAFEARSPNPSGFQDPMARFRKS